MNLFDTETIIYIYIYIYIGYFLVFYFNTLMRYRSSVVSMKRNSEFSFVAVIKILRFFFLTAGMIVVVI